MHHPVGIWGGDRAFLGSQWIGYNREYHRAEHLTSPSPETHLSSFCG